MAVLVAFAVGYVMGARGGSEGFDEVVRATAAIRESEEARGFVAAARSHLGHTLRELASRLDEGGEAEPDEPPTDLLEQVRSLRATD
jgi:hypothetical protein